MPKQHEHSEASSLQFLNRLQLVEPSLEERVSNLLDYFQWVRDAALVQKASQMLSTKSSENATTAPDLLGR
jgi:hypothetical protein